MCNQALVFCSLKSKLFEEECFSLGEKSEHMVTVTPFMGKLKVHIRQFYLNENGEMKPGKSGIVLEIE